MKTHIKTIVLFATLSSIALILISIRSKVEFTRVERPIALTHEQRAWLGALEWCESRGNPGAINEKDRDGTASYGILQFKPSTFDLFAKAYKINGELMNPESQEAIVTAMILHGGIEWKQQFPACTKRLGYPPARKDLQVITRGV